MKVAAPAAPPSLAAAALLARLRPSARPWHPPLLVCLPAVYRSPQIRGKVSAVIDGLLVLFWLIAAAVCTSILTVDDWSGSRIRASCAFCWITWRALLSFVSFFLSLFAGKCAHVQLRLLLDHLASASFTCCFLFIPFSSLASVPLQLQQLKLAPACCRRRCPLPAVACRLRPLCCCCPEPAGRPRCCPECPAHAGRPSCPSPPTAGSCGCCPSSSPFGRPGGTSTSEAKLPPFVSCTRLGGHTWHSLPRLCAACPSLSTPSTTCLIAPAAVLASIAFPRTSSRPTAPPAEACPVSFPRVPA